MSAAELLQRRGRLRHVAGDGAHVGRRVEVLLDQHLVQHVAEGDEVFVDGGGRILDLGVGDAVRCLTEGIDDLVELVDGGLRVGLTRRVDVSGGVARLLQLGNDDAARVFDGLVGVGLLCRSLSRVGGVFGGLFRCAPAQAVRPRTATLAMANAAIRRFMCDFLCDGTAKMQCDSPVGDLVKHIACGIPDGENSPSAEPSA